MTAHHSGHIAALTSLFAPVRVTQWSGNVGANPYYRRVTLTSAVSDEDHPVGKWLRTQLRRTAALRSSYGSDLPHRRVHRPVAPGRSVVRWDLLGIAIDFRVRCAFTAVHVAPSAAAGIALAGQLRGEWLSRLGMALLEAFGGHLASSQTHHRGTRWLLERSTEEHLDRLCFALSWYDRVYREGRLPPGSPLATVNPDIGLRQLLAIVPDYVIQDLQTQVLLAEQALGSLRDSSDEQECHAAPSFQGSGDVGGADADLLVAGRLIEIKSVSHPTALPDAMIHQLAGYLLLDYDDLHHIRELGFYMSRIGWLKLWQVEDFLRLVGARAPLSVLRAEFATAARAAMSS
jgi:hypothetical protein